MKDFARRKQYVEVVATPTTLTAPLGRRRSSWLQARSTRSRTAGRRLPARPTPLGNWPGGML